MKAQCKALLLLFLLVYILITFYSFYHLFYSNRERIKPNKVREVVEIWGKAAIADYLWSHIINGEILSNENGNIFGRWQTTRIEFIYRSGSQMVQDSFPMVQYLILVLNGRSQEKISQARLWLDYLPLYPNLKRTAVLILGDERCNNEWIESYLRSRGGLVDVLFVVYDWDRVDNQQVFQWPLGVATYRSFPDIPSSQIDLISSRNHVCNFQGTIYKNSSREHLVNFLNKTEQCIIHSRKEWSPKETNASLKRYINTILDSDLTLSPVGINTECYRIYEAMSLGSVPVVEDRLTPGECSRDGLSPLRLLKEYNAPVIWIKHWSEIVEVLKREEHLSWEEKIDRRASIVDWYKQFKMEQKQRFLNIIEKNFFFKRITFD